jgi:hypothetical protein
MIPGSIDLHVHCAPDVRPRKMTALELARAAKLAGMRGVVLKNHETSTTALAATALVDAARTAGARKILVNHPEIRFLSFSVAFQNELAGPGVWFERCFMRPNFTGSWDTAATAIRATGCANNVFATDLGQPDSIDPVTGLDRMQLEISKLGFTPEELRRMCVKNQRPFLTCSKRSGFPGRSLHHH